MSEEMRAELDAVERRVSGELDPGARGFVIAVTVLVLVVATVLPHAGSASGWDVLLGSDDARAEAITLTSRLFVGGTVLFGLLASVAAVLLRRWWAAWVATAGCGLTALFGLLAVWARQTVQAGEPGSGPGAGLVLAWVAVLVLVVQWLRLVWTQVPAPVRTDGATFTPRLREPGPRAGH